jgi:hypothetical protein
MDNYIFVTNYHDCPFLNLNVLFNPSRVGHPDDYRLSCNLQKDVIKSIPSSEWEKVFANCPIKKEDVIIVAIGAPNPERSVATDDQ